MWTNIDLRKCVSFIECGFQVKNREDAPSTPVRPAITISRMTGAGGHALASNLADYMQTHTPSGDQWTVFDRNLKDNFDKDIDDPMRYHVIINTDRVPHEEAAHLIGDEVIKRFRLCDRTKSVGSEKPMIH